MTSVKVQCITYNVNLGRGDHDLEHVLAPTLDESSVELASDRPPDVYAVAFQEIAPLHYGLLGWSDSYIAQRHLAIVKRLRHHPASSKDDEAYSLLAKVSHGGVALLVYVRDETFKHKVLRVHTSKVGCGMFKIMSNKGAVGVRITTGTQARAGQKEIAGEVFTFVSAHLAAHDSGLQRRNADYASIISRLLFKISVSDQLASIYDTSHVFFMGDLNYRLSLSQPANLLLEHLAHKMNSELKTVTPHDTLLQEHVARRVLQGLREGAITFKPTYKYKLNSGDTYNSFLHRTPGWTDRVFFASWNDDNVNTAKSQTSVDLYRAVQRYCASDHKPVTAIFTIPVVSLPASTLSLRLKESLPVFIDRDWRYKLAVGAILDKSVGSLFLGLTLAGFGNMKLGLANILLLITTTLYYTDHYKRFR